MSLVESHAKEATFCQLAKSGYHVSQGGDFRSPECVEILKKSDIVVTNPPFSLFREYVAQLVEHGTQFLIIGSKNAIRPLGSRLLFSGRVERSHI